MPKNSHNIGTWLYILCDILYEEDRHVPRGEFPYPIHLEKRERNFGSLEIDLDRIAALLRGEILDS